MGKELVEEKLEQKIKEKDKLKLKYKQKLELVKQHYGVNFDVYYLKNDNIDKIKFVNLEFKNLIKNITLIYDNKVGSFNYLFYDYDNEQDLKNYDEYKIINKLNQEKKLKLVVAEIQKMHDEYKKELKEIDDQYAKNNQGIVNELEYKKKVENS